MDSRRIRLLKNGEKNFANVAYWMSRDQRLSDNWALIFALKKAKENNASFCVFFCLVPDFLDASSSHYRFMLQGIKETEHELKKINIPFYLIQGKPEKKYPIFTGETSKFEAPIFILPSLNPLVKQVAPRD